MSAPEEPRPRGAGAWIREHRTGVLAVGLSAVFVLIAAGVFAAGYASVARATPAPTVSARASVSPTPTVRPTPASIPAPTRLRTCSIAATASDPRLGTLQGQVVNAATGEVLFDRRGGAPARTAGLVQVLTAASALAVLGPDYRIPTSVVDLGGGAIAIVGRGDPTLSRTPVGSESVYAGAPKLADLAAQTIAAWTAKHPGQRITALTLDDSYWDDADAWDPTWPESARTRGDQSQATALQVDGDRDNPFVQQSPRSSDAVGRAGDLVTAALRAADPGAVVAESLQVTRGKAPTSAPPLAEVLSQPVSTLLPQMLASGDNTLAEMLARISSVQAGAGGTAASLGAVIVKALSAYELPTDGIALRDGSGVSPEDAVPPRYLAQLMIKVDGGAQNLDVLRDGLPIAGESGSLQTRFTGTAAEPRGKVTAMTGRSADVEALSGVVDARDGTALGFAFSALGAGIGDSAGGAAALDALIAAVYACGDNLAGT
ncbi:MAG: D-alanyl-D-alanine carboxypeptidase [Micrococcales bacterium]|nr:D-alanyl-D-alanine carboxypeptidase [Micrococcales bacterium]